MEPTVADSVGKWRLGPEHKDYAYSGQYGYPVLAPAGGPSRSKRRSQWNGGKRGLNMAKRFRLTTSGEAARGAYPTRAVEPVHAHCPPSLRWLCEGELPVGWIKAGGAS